MGSRSIGRRGAPSSRGEFSQSRVIFHVPANFRFPVVLIKSIIFAFCVGVALWISYKNPIGAGPEPTIVVRQAFLQDGVIVSRMFGLFVNETVPINRVGDGLLTPADVSGIAAGGVFHLG
jgi:hypothetical protein